MLIGKLAHQLGTSAKTIRYYEGLGLLAEPTRSEAGYRLYGPEDAERLRFILGAKALGLTLDEIKETLAVWAHGQAPCGHVSQLLDEKLAALDRRIEELVGFRDELRAYKARLDAMPLAAGTPCKHVEGVAQGDWKGQAPKAELR